MLTKLLKKDLQATSRTFLPLILGFVLVSILAKIMFEVILFESFGTYTSDMNTFMTIIAILIFVLYIFYIVVCSVMSYVFLILDFYKTMVGEQAYLTHTLPVKTSALLNSKLLISLLWQSVVGILIALSIFLFAVGHIDSNLDIIRVLVVEFECIMGFSFFRYVLFMIAALIAGALSGPLMFYASIAIGHLFGKQKILGAILSYLGIYAVMQVITVAAFIGFGYTVSFNTPSPELMMPDIFSSIMWFTLLFTVLTVIIFYIITNYVLSRKLNLE